MQIGMVGLGKMGRKMALRLARGGHSVVVWDRDKKAIRQAVGRGVSGATSLQDMVKKLRAPRCVWIMVPAGAPTVATLQILKGLLKEGDTIIDGGNSHYTESQKAARALAPAGILFLDCGTSGGIWGLAIGYCLMIGGDKKAYRKWEPIFRALAPRKGYGHMGPSGSGHFVKMVHNAIEYGMLQAYGEGFEIMKASGFNLSLPQIAALWNRGSVIRSWLLELAASALSKDSGLKKIGDFMADSGEGRWGLAQAIDTGVPSPVLAASLFARFRSRQKSSFSGKLIAALRNEFGGHAVQKSTGR